MYIQRDISPRLAKNASAALVLIGPRQCGKSTLLSKLGGQDLQLLTFDDLQLRQLAHNDPMLFLEQFPPPLLLDEVQYAPNLFPEIKKRIDTLKQQRLHTNASITTHYYMTGSNQLLMDKQVKESLVGRASYFYLNTLTVHEIINAQADTSISEILYKGGWPELYIDPNMAPVQYLNDYIRGYIEKDIILSAGIQKQQDFTTLLGLLAARTGMLLELNNLARDSGVSSTTIKDWISILERNQLVSLLKPYATNLNKRLIKTPKLYFLDTGLAARLQGWQDASPMLLSPQAGALFETLVYNEIVKFCENYGKDWQTFLWRTKEGEEIDFLIITAQGQAIALDAKMSIQSVQARALPRSFTKLFPQHQTLHIITLGGDQLQLSPNCTAIPIAQLHDFLLRFH